MSTSATVVGLAAAVCTTGANVPQLKKAWTTGQTDDISMNMLWLLASGRASFQRPVRAGVAYGRYCVSCCGPYAYALVVLAGGTRSVWLGAGLTSAYAVSMVAPTLLVAAIAPATSQRLAERAVSVSPTVERLTGLMLVGLGVVLVPAALAGAAA